MVSTLPLPCQEIIRAYLRLDFGQGRLVATPYYKNSPHEKRFTDPVDAGKGGPHEIIADVHARALMQRVQIDLMNAEDVRNFMISQGVGVDCSGLAAHVLNAYSLEKSGKPIEYRLRPSAVSFWRKILFQFRPFQNINVLTLTSPENSVPVALDEIKPGDLMRTRGGKHVLVVSEAERENGKLISFCYVHSSGQFGEDSGAREGKVVITDSSKDLGDQEWKEGWHGRIPAREGWREEREKNGIFRLKAIE